MSLVPVLRGEQLADRALFWHYPHYGNQGGEPSSIIIENQWKLIHYHEDGRDELYRLTNDPGEQTDVAGAEPARAMALRKKLDAWLKATDAKFPTKDPQFDPTRREARWQSLRTSGKANLERRHAAYLDAGFRPNKDWWGSAAQD